jgi:nucleobase:cation symporter-1, NCS1 family
MSENVLQNWRAAAAMVVSVPPTFPGLIDSIKASANVGAGPHLFDIAYMLGVRSLPWEFDACLDLKGQFALASLVYFTLSKLFPSHETVLEHAIIELETTHGEKVPAGGFDGAGGQVEVANDVWTVEGWLDGMKENGEEEERILL